LFAVTAAVTVLVACGPQGRPENSQVVSAPSSPKVLTIANLTEPPAWIEGSMANPLVHRELGAWDQAGAWVPQLASEIISPQHGSWRVNADGSMDTDWKIRPGLAWHDGTPFTSADLVFAWEVYKAPEASPPDGTARQLMTSATATDPLTVTIHWSAIYVDADKAPNLVPLPRHLLEERFRAGWDQYASSSVHRTEFVGLGPYKVAQWEPGSHAELVAFEQFFLCKPRIDRIVLRFIGDPNTMMANLQAGAIEVITGGSQVLLPIALNIEKLERQQGTSQLRIAYSHAGNLRMLELQHRPEHARPTNGTPNRLVRQALTHATDRQLYTEIVTEGKAPPVDSWIGPREPIRAQVDDSIPKYPHDPRRARQLLEEAGWATGPDGVYVHQTSRERFEIGVYATAGGTAEQISNLVADMWKSVGMQAEPAFIPAARENDREYRATIPGVVQGGLGPRGFYGGRLYIHSQTIASPENRWNGANRIGYSNPQVDGLLDRLATTIDERQRVLLHRDLLQAAMTDAPFIPLHIGVSAMVYARQVTGIHGEYIGNGAELLDIHEWDKRP
jgi:peptide/nickel transport system substrate-binding protein